MYYLKDELAALDRATVGKTLQGMNSGHEVQCWAVSTELLLVFVSLAETYASFRPQ